VVRLPPAGLFQKKELALRVVYKAGKLPEPLVRREKSCCFRNLNTISRLPAHTVATIPSELSQPTLSMGEVIKRKHLSSPG
jgi:hypothetical protein